MHGSARNAVWFAAGAAAGGGLVFALVDRRRRRRWKRRATHDAGPPSPLPPFALRLESDPSLHRVRLREWEDPSWRASSGWRGRDLCHNPDGRAVRVLSYYRDECSPGKELIGVVWFGPDAESHRGLCHGGAMTSLMDDFAGHASFVSSDAPWSGATVQVNCALRRPVPVGSVLRIVGRVSKKEGRKVHVEAVLDDGGGGGEGVGGGDPVVYATLKGLSIEGVKISERDDAVADRKWEVEVCAAGLVHRRDSGWKIK